MQKSHLIYVRKHHGKLGYWIIKALFVVSAQARQVVFGGLSLLRDDDLSRARLRLSTAALRFHLLGQEPVS
jgi:hypothetical protein